MALRWHQVAKLHLVARSSTGWQPVLGEDRRPVTRPADFSKTHRRPGLACQVVWMGSWRSGALLWSRRTPKLVKEDPKLVKKDPKIGQERPLIGQERPIIGFVFWRNMPNMWVLAALGRCGWHSETFLLCMYYLCNCTMIRSSMMMIIRKLCCLCNPMIQQ